MRKNIKSIGLILAIIIAGVSLPISIISFMDKPTHITEINNYYNNTTIIETYNNTIIERYNNTIVVIVNNTDTIVEEIPIPDRSKPIEEHYFYINTTHPFHIIGNYTMGLNELYLTDQPNIYAITFYAIDYIWFDLWNETDGEIGRFDSSSFNGQSSQWTPQYLTNWIIVCTNQVPANNWDYTVYDAIITKF